MAAGPGLRVQLLGQFVMYSGDRTAGPWPRPTARRLVELLLVAPGHRVRRDVACEALFGDRDQRSASRALSKALSMARTALAELGEPGSSLLAADLNHIWLDGPVETDAEVHEAALRAALGGPAGPERAGELRAALGVASAEGELLADEPDEEWARPPRARLAALRQEARLALARDLASGPGTQDDAMAAWQSCLDHDRACEEAAGALARAYLARHRPEQAARVLQRCRAALEELGLRLSPSLESAYSAVTTVPVPSPSPEKPAPREERRPVSVLFAEVAAASAALGTGDLEELREAVGRVLATVMTEAEALGGTVASVSGRGLQVLFGVPAAHEDDPERAVRAAYRSVARTPPGAVLRIGVESGPAVVGPVVGGGRTEYAAFGDVVSVAAGLQSAARPGAVLVGPATRAATEHLFTWDPPEKVELDPGAEPVPASYLAGPRGRSGGRRPALGGTAPLIGREAERQALARTLRDLAGGRGSVVALTGEPGIGKTRLTQEARTRFLAWTGAGTGSLPLWLAGRCSSYASGTPYGLYRDLLAGWTGVSPDQPEALRLSALEEALARLMGNTNLLPPLARLLGLPGADRTASPAETQRMIFDAMRVLVTRLTAVAPTVLVLEDLHWADPTSLHLTRQLAELTRDQPLLMLVTARSEAASDAGSLAPGVRMLPLRRLSTAEARALVRSLIGEGAEDVLDAVVSPAGGNPLFLEERLAALLETHELVRHHETWSLRDTGGPGLSQVLERLVRSRVDRLSPAAQQAVRAASVLGFEFRAAQLSAMLGEEPAAALKELQASDLIHHKQPRGPEPAFVFRHALIGDAVYLGLLRAERRALHERAAAAIETAAGSEVPHVAAVLGRHYAAADRAEQAVRFLEMAGDHATDAFANDEAISSFRAAIDLTAGHGAMAETAVRLYDKVAHVLWRTGRRPETRDAFREALRIGASDPLRQAYLHTRHGRVNLLDSRFADAEACFDAAEALLGDDPATRDDAFVDRWLELMIDGRTDLHWLRGELDLAEETLDGARSVLEARGTPERRVAYYRLAIMLRLQRRDWRPADEDVELLRRSLEFARQTGVKKDIAYAAYFLGYGLGLHGELEEARETEEAAVDLAERVGESYLLPGTLVALGLLALRQGDTSGGRMALDRVIRIARQNESVGGATLTSEETAAQIVLRWLDRSADGPGLDEEFAQLMGATAGTARRHLEPLAALARDLEPR